MIDRSGKYASPRACAASTAVIARSHVVGLERRVYVGVAQDQHSAQAKIAPAGRSPARERVLEGLAHRLEVLGSSGPDDDLA